MKKSIKAIAISAVAALAVAGLVACGGGSSDDKPTQARFVTGGESGTYYAVGNVIANDITNNVPNVTVTALVGNGSKANCVALKDGDAELALCQSDVMAYAYMGTNIFADEGKITNFRTLGALYMEDVQIVTCDPAIKTVADLKGKTVSVGAVGSGVYFNAVDVLTAYGMTLDDINPSYQSFGDSADSLANGQIDAAFIVAGAPTSAITNLSTTKQAYLVSIEAAQVQKLLAASPYYVEHVIPAGTYSGITTDTRTVAVAAVILVREDLSEAAVYGMTAELFDNLKALEASHAKFAEMSIEFGASVESVPYHAGAAKYFAEKGITVPTK